MPPAIVGACVYLLGLPTAFTPDVPLVVLAGAAASTALAGPRPSRGALRSPLALATLACVAATAISTMLSVDPGRSARLSAPLLPAVLLFVSIAGWTRDARDVRALCGAASVAALAVALHVLAVVWQGAPKDATELVRAIDDPLLVVPNDCIFLAAVAPLSASLCASAGRLLRLVAAASLLATAAAMALLESRIAAAGMVIGLASAGLAGGRRRGIPWMLAVAAAMIVTDWARGFPLVAKFAATGLWNTRLALWLSAWALFRAAPLVGHGPRSFGILYPEYLRGLHLPPWLPIDERIAPWPHNLALELLAEQGMLGFAAFAVLIVATLVGAWRASAGRDPDTRMLAAGLFGSTGVFIFGAMGELTFLRHWVVVICLTQAALVAHMSTHQDSKGGPR